MDLKSFLDRTNLTKADVLRKLGRDLKDGRRLPWVVHLAGFFGLFTFVADLAICLGKMKPEELTVYIQVPAFAGVFLLWLSVIYVSITREQWK